MIHNEWIARDAVSALGRFCHRIRIPPRAVGRLRAWVFDLRYLLNRALTGSPACARSAGARCDSPARRGDAHQPDDRIRREVILANWGYENLVTTTDSARAIQLCLESPPALLLLDLQMPPPTVTK
jgi:hypothetical protein